MANYKFALNSSGFVIQASDIANKPVSDTYKCLGCDNELIAKVNGSLREPHFAHKSKVECNGETYLHKLGKHTFYQKYNDCLSNNTPFNIKLSSTRLCKKFKPLLLTNCNLGSTEKTYDLTNYYSEINIEKRDESFIPDLLLSSRSNPNEKIYIEIAVTHFLSNEKENSNKKIIEITLEDESDISKITKGEITSEDALFINFNQSTTAISDSDCKCAHKPIFAFFVFNSGKALLQRESLTAAYEYMHRNKNSIIYSNLINQQTIKENEILSNTEHSGALFVEQVKLAYERQVKIRNCYLCKYKGENWDYDRQNPIFCRGKKIKCTSNQAATCDWYKPVAE